jgi:hypothetical protein
MAKLKLDGVVEAVRYKPDGKIAWVRAYERRGPTYSDHVLISREELIQRLKSGKNYYAGQRVLRNASTFEISAPLRLVVANGSEVVVAGDESANRDMLKGVPLV